MHYKFYNFMIANELALHYDILNNRHKHFTIYIYVAKKQDFTSQCNGKKKTIISGRFRLKII